MGSFSVHCINIAENGCSSHACYIILDSCVFDFYSATCPPTENPFQFSKHGGCCNKSFIKQIKNCLKQQLYLCNARYTSCTQTLFLRNYKNMTNQLFHALGQMQNGYGLVAIYKIAVATHTRKLRIETVLLHHCLNSLVPMLNWCEPTEI